MIRALSLALSFLFVTSLGWAKHGPMEPEEKIRMSDLILVGTVTEVKEVSEKAAPNTGLAETAHSAAVVKVERVIKGKLEAETVEVGFNTDYACDTVSFEVGGKYVLFLRKLSRPLYATVNWQYGAKPVVEGKVDDLMVRWPETQIPLEDALSDVAQVVERQAAEEQDEQRPQDGEGR